MVHVAFNRHPRIQKLLPVIAEKGEIIDVAEVFAGFEFFFNEVVKAAEVDIGEELASEVANGQAFAVLERGEQVITGEVFEAGVLLIAVVDDEVDEPEGVGAFDFAADDVLEDDMINAGEIFAHVALENVATAAGELDEALEGAVGAVAGAVGVAIGDEAALDGGHDDVAEGMVDNAVPVGGSGDEARLGVEDAEGAVATRSVGVGLELLLEAEEVAFEVVVKVEDVAAKAFAALGLVGGFKEVFKAEDGGPEVAEAFH